MALKSASSSMTRIFAIVDLPIFLSPEWGKVVRPKRFDHSRV